MPSHQSKLTEQRLATGLASNDLKAEFVMPIQLVVTLKEQPSSGQLPERLP
jgi:hypothetical protein